MEAHELMSIKQVLNALGLSAILFYFLVPSMLAMLTVYGVRRSKRKHKLEQAEKEKQEKEAKAKEKEAEQQSKQQAKQEKEKYHITREDGETYKSEGLGLEFDSSGKIKK